MPDELRERYQQRRALLQQLGGKLEEATREALGSMPHIDRVSFRVKSVDSFMAKAAQVDSLYENPLVEIEDQVAGRVIVFFLSDIDVVLQKLRGTFNAVEGVRKRPARDEEFSYESHHLVCTIPPHLEPVGFRELLDAPNTFELQVRTIFMHAYSEPQHDFAYKAAEDLPGNTRRELAWIAASAWGADQAYERVLKWARDNGHV